MSLVWWVQGDLCLRVRACACGTYGQAADINCLSAALFSCDTVFYACVPGAGRMQTTKIGELSDGQKSRIVFGMICMKNPNLLLLDEPTNHLDIEAIDSLAEAIKGFKGGLVLVSHDFRLIDQVRPAAL